MKHVFFYITSALFLCFINNWVLAQDTLPRIGSTIDSLEREYFGLFPTIPGFTEAKANMSDSGISFQVRYFFQQKSRDTVFSLQQLGKAELIRLIDNFETVADVEPPIDYKKIQPVGNAEITYPRYNLGSGSVSTFVTHDNRINRMQLLYAADSALLLLHVDSVYRWRSINSAQLLRMKDIRRITNNDYWWGGWVVGAGLAINGMLQLQEKPSWDFLGTLLSQTPIISIGIAQWMASGFQSLSTNISFDSTGTIPSGKTLSSQDLFTDIVTPELIPLTNNEYRSTIGEFTSAPNYEWPLIKKKKTSAHIWGTLGYLLLSKQTKYQLAVISSVELRTITLAKYSINVGGDFELSPSFRLGGTVTFTTGNDTKKSADRVSHYSPSAYISYMVIPSNQFQTQSDYQVYIGIAADIVNSYVEKNNPYTPSEALSSDRLHITPAIVLGSSFSFYLSDYFSLISRIESHLSSPTKNEGFTVHSPPLLRGFSHSLSFSFTQASIGLQYSF